MRWWGWQFCVHSERSVGYLGKFSWSPCSINADGFGWSLNMAGASLWERFPSPFSELERGLQHEEGRKEAKEKGVPISIEILDYLEISEGCPKKCLTP
jgi:hypothetical protein